MPRLALESQVAYWIAGAFVVSCLVSFLIGVGIGLGDRLPAKPLCQLCSHELKPVQVRPVGQHVLPTMPVDAAWYCAGNYHVAHKFVYYGELERKPEALPEL